MPKLVRESDDVSSASEEVMPRQLCYEGGDVIIFLTSDPEGDMILHSELLKGLSPAFRGVTKDVWNVDSAKTVDHPTTTEEIKFFRYYLVYDQKQGIVSLESKAPRSRISLEHQLCIDQTRLTQFYTSDVAHGYASRRHQAEYGISDVRIEHKILFLLLMKEPTDLTNCSYDNIANIAAYAELYGVLEFIAPALRDYLLTRDDIWSDVRLSYRFHLGLAIKLRCKEIYQDALRHFVGNDAEPFENWTSLTTIFDLKDKDAFRISLLRQKLGRNLDTLMEGFRTLRLTTYIHNAEWRDHDDPAKTTLVLSKRETSGYDNVLSIAQRIVSEWLDHQLYSPKHCSHLRKERGLVGDIHIPSSFRNACNLVAKACQTGTEVEIFTKGAAEMYVGMANLTLGTTFAVQHVNEHLKEICHQMAALALPYIAAPNFRAAEDCETFDDKEAEKAELGPPVPDDVTQVFTPMPAPLSEKGFCTVHPKDSHYASCYLQRKEFLRVGMTAKDDRGCHYFTCVDVDEEDVPWQEDWEGFRIDGLEPATEGWLKAVKEADDLPARVDGEKSLAEWRAERGE